MKNKFNFNRRLKHFFLIFLSVCLYGGLSAYSQETQKTSADSLSVKSKANKPLAIQKNDKIEMADMFVHPFLTYMSLPDPREQ